MVGLACAALRTRPGIRDWLLLIFSLCIIATWGLAGLVIFLVIAIFNFGAASVMSRMATPSARIVLIATILLDVATLATFKYTDFIASNLAVFGLEGIPKFPLSVPLAISFYTFHIISYLVDVYCGRVRPTNFTKFLFYLSFFPHVVAGPIVRAWQLIPQIGSVRPIRTDLIVGLHFMVTGFFLKTVVADNIAGGIDPLWLGHAALTSADLWLLAVLYYFQIYGDFAGYSLMALGMARLVGYRLPANFRLPMNATSLRDFWRRWHITLSNWLRDYVYFALGGSRRKGVRTTINLLLTMLIGGLWHGAAWGFLLWGAMHGIGLAIEHSLRSRRLGELPGARYFFWFITQTWIVLAWVPFRAPDASGAMSILGKMGSFFTTLNFSTSVNFWPLFLVALPIVIHHFAPWIMRAAGKRNLGYLMGITTAVLLVLSITVMAPSHTFIYFKF